ncbi:ABC transporter permease [bacterium]|nr:ABC transporter permease [bacterium]
MPLAIKSFWRALTRHKTFSLINVLGLAVGLASCVLIYLYAVNELTYDRFHQHSDRTYLIMKERHLPTGVQELYDTWIPVRDALLDRYPEIESAVRVVDRDEPVFVGDQGFQRTVLTTDPEFFEMFDFRLSGGRDGKSVLQDHDQVIVSQETALELFGTTTPAGEKLMYNDREYVVAGVLAPFPRNSSYNPQLIVPFGSVYDMSDPEVANLWNSSFLETWLRLPAGMDPAAFEQTLEEYIEFQFGTDGPNARGNMYFRLIALQDLHEQLAGTRTISLSLLVIAIIILIIAVVNFTNLSTASSFRRAGEIGMRKVMGAGRMRLIRQFLFESFFITLLALVLAIGMIEIVRPWMNSYFNIDLRFPLTTDWRVAGWLLAFAAGVSLLAGMYPAFVLSSFRPTQTLKGKSTRGRGASLLRNSLLGLQFVLAIALLSLTAIVWQQIHYMKNANLNLDTSSVVAIEYSLRGADDPEAAGQSLLTAKAEMEKLPGVQAVANGSGVPGDYIGANTFARPVGYEEDVPFRIMMAAAGAGYFDLYEMPFVDGGPFTAEQIDTNQPVVVLNETCARIMGVGVGDEIITGEQQTVIGILADHHFAPLTQEIRPIVYLPASPTFRFSRYLSVKLAPGDVSATLEQMRAIWSEFDASGTFNFQFVDERFRALYSAQERIITLAGIFALIGVMIASLGLFGLISYAVVLRTREIGIRKVLGAEVRHILSLVGKDYLRPVLLANLIAWPVAWWLGSLYLQEFPYRMNMNLAAFALATLFATLLAAGTMTVTAWRAASSKPSETLRHE